MNQEKIKKFLRIQRIDRLEQTNESDCLSSRFSILVGSSLMGNLKSRKILLETNF